MSANLSVSFSSDGSVLFAGGGKLTRTGTTSRAFASYVDMDTNNGKIGDDEYYWDDLISLEVVNTEGVALGVVRGLLETGAHAVLQVAGPEVCQRERLIPFVDAYVREVDRAGSRILLEWGADWDKD